MNSTVRDLKRLLSILSIIAIIAFIGLLLLETITLLYAAPMVTDSITCPDMGNASSIILPESDVMDRSGNIRFSISPEVNGTESTAGGYYIFTPNGTFKDGMHYTATYGDGQKLNFNAVDSGFDVNVLSTRTDMVIVSFSRNIVHQDAESLVSFNPSAEYNTSWYGNTLLINVSDSNTSPHYPSMRTFSMKGTVNLTDGTEKDVSISAQCSPYGVYSDTKQVPIMPSTVVYAIIPPGFLIGLDSIEGSAFQGYFIFIVAAIISSIGYAAYKDRYTFMKRFSKDMNSQNIRIPSDSVFFEIGALLMASISFSLITYLLVYFFNQNPKIPPMGSEPLWANLYALARAGVWEEIITRIPFIGIPLLITHILMKRKTAPLWRYFFGGGFEMDWPSMLFLFLSALFFGLAHAFGGWDMFKVLPAMVGGLAMGYLYLKWGIYASITLHFANDYMSLPPQVFSSQGMDTMVSLTMLFMVGMGLFFFYLYFAAFLRKLFPASVPAYEAPVMRGRNELYGPPKQYQYPQDPYYQNQPYGQYAPQYPPYPPYQAQYQYPQYPPYPPSSYSNQASQQEISVSPSGYVSYKPKPMQPPSDIPYAPFPFICIRCGGRTATFRDDGMLVCSNCGMMYRLKKDNAEGDFKPKA